MKSITKHKVVSVLLSGPYNKTFDYVIFEESYNIGQFVLVPFRNQEILGLIVGRGIDNLPNEKLKKISMVINLPLISSLYIEFLNFFSDWNCVDKGNVFKLFLGPFDKKSIKNIKHKNYQPIEQQHFDLKKDKNAIQLNKDQQIASKIILKSFNSSNPKCFLLEGVAGSGKTETYFEAVKHCIINKKQVLILLPEIGLTADWETRFHRRFGFKPKIWHSGITKSARKKIWLSALYKKELVLVGARSSLFVPFNNLGLIIIDEEHDLSFKQEEGISYHARDMGIYLASKKKIPIILSSATPSIETLYNAKIKKFFHLNLPSRATGSELPNIKIIDLKKTPPSKGSWISKVMLDELTRRYKKNDQSLLFLNRRGYSPLTLCKSCGYRVHCNNCNSWLVEHKKKKIYLCHHCGFNKPVDKLCQNCNEPEMVSCGPGIEKINEEIKNFFPKANIENFSSDSFNDVESFYKSLQNIIEGKVDFIIGTQLLAKGYDFPKLNFVGIVDGDIGTYGGDLRASEKCYQLLTQVSGRAGRHIKNDRGLVFLQTYNPNNSLINTIREMNKNKFFEEELKYRKIASMPPFSRLISIIISCNSEKILNEFSLNFLANSPKYKEIDVFGPAPAPLYYVRGRYRNRFLIRSMKNIHLQNIVKQWVDLNRAPKNIRIKIDVDPYNFL